MKAQVKQKQIRTYYNNVFFINGCELSDIIKESISPCGYNAGVYGWNFDVYDFGANCIVIGYRPIGKHLQEEKELIKLIHKKCRKNKFRRYNPQKLSSVITDYLNGI